MCVIQDFGVSKLHFFEFVYTILVIIVRSDASNYDLGKRDALLTFDTPLFSALQDQIALKALKIGQNFLKLDFSPFFDHHNTSLFRSIEFFGKIQ